MHLLVVDLHVADLHLGLPSTTLLLFRLINTRITRANYAPNSYREMVVPIYLFCDALEESVAQPRDDSPTRLRAQHGVGFPRAYQAVYMHLIILTYDTKLG